MLILVDSPDPAVRIGFLSALALTLPFAAILGILIFALIRSLRQKAETGNQGMIGLIGVAIGDIGRTGRVKVRGEYWTARSSATIDSGSEVRVVSVDNLVLQVEKLKE
jgi:membrane-bound serine protease (ClpP class)